MKKSYVAPELCAEVYELSMSIAGCGIPVTDGPESPDGKPACSDYQDPFAAPARSARRQNVQFWDDEECDCYTTAGQYGGYWHS